MSVAVWITIAAFIGGVVGYWLGYSAAYRQAAMAMAILRMESEMYIGILSRKEDKPD